MDQRLVWIALGVAVVLIMCWLLLRWRSRSRSGPGDAGSDRLDTVTGWPPKATRILTTAERLAYDILARALPDHMIFAQVPLARFLKVPTRNSYVEWMRRLGGQCADLVVCDRASQVIAVVDVQAPADQSGERARKRLNRMARVLKAAGIPLHVWTEGLLPSVDAARATILPAPTTPSSTAAVEPPPVVASSPATPTATTINPFDDADRDPSADEFIEAREPPPSTWFDEFNSGPTPLSKPPRKK